MLKINLDNLKAICLLITNKNKNLAIWLKRNQRSTEGEILRAGTKFKKSSITWFCLPIAACTLFLT